MDGANGVGEGRREVGCAQLTIAWSDSVDLSLLGVSGLEAGLAVEQGPAVG